MYLLLHQIRSYNQKPLCGEVFQLSISTALSESCFHKKKIHKHTKIKLQKYLRKAYLNKLSLKNKIKFKNLDNWQSGNKTLIKKLKIYTSRYAFAWIIQSWCIGCQFKLINFTVPGNKFFCSLWAQLDLCNFFFCSQLNSLLRVQGRSNDRFTGIILLFVFPRLQGVFKGLIKMNYTLSSQHLEYCHLFKQIILCTFWFL